MRAARDAFEPWAATPPPERAQVLFRIKQALEDHVDDLAALITRENGKTTEEARGDVRRGIEVVDFACGAPTLLQGRNLDDVSTGVDQALFRFPVGVVAGITPFNFPAMIPLWMIAPALACGNAFILKPSQRTPMTAMRIADLCREAGLPPGVLSVVHGAGEVVDTLLGHPGIDAVSFVGSAAVASHIYSTAAAAGKRVQALAGAKNHLVVMDDAQLDQAVPAVLSSAFGMAGQRCLAGSVAVGVGSLADGLAQELAAASEDLAVGPGDDPNVDFGPVIRDGRRAELATYVEEAGRSGATVVADGRKLLDERGFFFGPTILDRVTPEMPVWRDELFGPVLSVSRASTLDEAVATLNSSRYGNMASIFTTSGKVAREFRRRADAGMIGVNIGVAAPMAFFPFSGWKGSFFGDLHATGTDSFRFYTRTKVVSTRWP